VSLAAKTFWGITLLLFLVLTGVFGEMAQNGRYAVKAYQDYYVVIDTRLGKAEKRSYETAPIVDLDAPMNLVDAYLDGY
jgi:hypothetical protein